MIKRSYTLVLKSELRTMKTDTDTDTDTGKQTHKQTDKGGGEGKD